LPSTRALFDDVIVKLVAFLFGDQAWHIGLYNKSSSQR
jgi:hypothetical protein